MELRRKCMAAGGFVLLLCLMAAFPSNAEAQFAKRQQATVFPNTAPFTHPQLLNADTDPTLRYPIASLPGLTCGSLAYGWLDISHAGIHFKVVQPLNKLEDGFDAHSADITEVKIWQTSVKFKIGQKKHIIFYVDESNWGTVHECAAYYAAESLGERGTGSIYGAFLNFNNVLAQVKAAIPPPAPVVPPPVVAPLVAPPEPKAAPSAPPIVVLSTPSGGTSNHVVDVTDAGLTVRGYTMDNTGIPVVKINGTSANMRPQSSQTAEFWSEPLTLLPGDNPIDIVASNAANLETKVVFLVRFTPAAKPIPVAPKGLSKDEIISLLRGDVPSERVAALVKERDIKFLPNNADLGEIRTAGGTDELIQAIQKAGPHP